MIVPNTIDNNDKKIIVIIIIIMVLIPKIVHKKIKYLSLIVNKYRRCGFMYCGIIDNILVLAGSCWLLSG